MPARKLVSGEQLSVKKMLHAHFGGKHVEKMYIINETLFDAIIGNML